jgi:predicted phage-related endonuclease
MKMTKGTLSKRIEKLKYPDSEPRPYIGASSIGSDCLRQIWFEFTGEKATPAPARLQRIWEMGRILEEFVIDLIVMSGVEVLRTRDSSSKLGFFDNELNYFQGHADGILLQLNAILEVKTAKDASFKLFLRQGLQQWSPKYYAQVQAYMGMSGIKMAYIIVLNKDTSELMDEKIEFDNDFYQMLKRKAKMIHDAVSPPPKINGSPLFYKCKQCKFNKVCHK